MGRERPLLVQPHMLAGPSSLKNYFDIEHKMDLLPPFVLIMLALQIITFAWSGYTYMLNPSDNLLIEGQYQSYWLSSPNGWMRMVSSTFLHAGLDHLIGNMALFYISGVMLEHLFGTRVTAACYALAVFSQGFASSYFYDSKTATVGASGAIFGLVGFLIAMYARYRREIFVRHRMAGVMLGGLTLYSLYMGFTSEYVNNAAHLGGFVFGVIFAMLVEPFFVKSGKRPKDRSGVRLVAVASVVLALGPFFIYSRNLSPHGNLDWETKLANAMDFLFAPSGVTTPEIIYRVKVEKRLRDRELERENAKGEAEREKAKEAAEKTANKPETDNSGEEEAGKDSHKEPTDKDLQDAHDRGVQEQGVGCKICRRGSSEPCECKPECKWTYFHHFQDSECRIKIKTTVWGPNTGSPFRLGFEDLPCYEAVGRYYRWEPPRNDCYAPVAE